MAVSVAACGGGGGGGDAAAGTGGNGDGSQSSLQISGVAAVGAPLVGTVTVKDALGATRTYQIGINGSYTADVTGMTAPFVFRAEGTANGTRASVHSVATAADANGHINITQLTDLVVSNIAGQLAQNYFDRFEQAGNSALADPALVAAEVDKLREKLLPVLAALGVEASIDLLHGTFTPAVDPIDKALDVIRVSYDTTANTATISNVVNGITVQDNLAVPAAAETAPATLSATNVAAAVSDQDAVRQVLANFTAKFAAGLPAAADLTPLMTSNFLWGDEDGATSAAEMSGNPNLVGGAFTDVQIRKIDYANPNGVTAHLSFSVKSSQGVELGRLDNWKVRKNPADGIWRLHGDQRSLDLDWFAVTSQYHLANGSTCVNTGLEFNIKNLNPGNDGGAIAYVVVKGPGLPPAGLRYQEPTLGGRWMIQGANRETYLLASTCAGESSALNDTQIAAIPDNAEYTLTLYNSSNAPVTSQRAPDGSYLLPIERRPLTLAEAGASGVFPVIDAATVSAFSTFGTAGGTIAFAASNVYPLSQAYVQMRRQNASFGMIDDVERDVLPTSAGAVSASLSFGSNPQVAYQAMWVESIDAHRRNLQTYYHK
jgi:hypothetical protein